MLRQRARRGSLSPKQDESKDNRTTDADIYNENGNINFFKDAESGNTLTGTNKDYEEEKKKEQEKYEKSIGLLTYLGQDSQELKGGLAWYENKDNRIVRMEGDEELDLKGKNKLDPISTMIKYAGYKKYNKSIKEPSPLSKDSNSKSLFDYQKHTFKTSKLKHKKKKKSEKKNKKSKKNKRDCSTNSDTDEFNLSIKSKDKKKFKKSKHKRKRKHRDSSSDSSDDPSLNRDRKKKRKYSSSRKDSDTTNDYKSSSESEKDMIKKMRAERLKREEFERKRSERLLAGKDPDKEPEPEPLVKQKYNSQFNPLLAKQNKAPKLQSGVKYWLQ